MPPAKGPSTYEWSKLTPEVQARICQAIRTGSTYAMAAQYGGISRKTFYVWLNKGETQRRGPYADFRADVLKAEADAAIGWLAKIEKAANDGAWQAAAWKLERRYPQEYGRTVQEHQGVGGGDLKIIIEYADTNIDTADTAPESGESYP